MRGAEVAVPGSGGDPGTPCGNIRNEHFSPKKNSVCVCLLLTHAVTNEALLTGFKTK